ncbi:MAG: DinB family protein [Chloroflexi bacterium]|nr:DinB family protein [Chloroflexota bacterium]
MVDGSRADLLERLARFPADLAAASGAGLSGGGSAAGAGPASGDAASGGEWGPAEITRHLIAVEEEVWQTRLDAMVASDEPRWDRVEPGQVAGLDDASLAVILATFARARSRTLAIVRALDQPGWARAGIHATYGRLDVAGLLRVAIDHDQEHLASIPRTHGERPAS